MGAGAVTVLTTGAEGPGFKAACGGDLSGNPVGPAINGYPGFFVP